MMTAIMRRQEMRKGSRTITTRAGKKTKSLPDMIMKEMRDMVIMKKMTDMVIMKKMAEKTRTRRRC